MYYYSETRRPATQADRMFDMGFEPQIGMFMQCTRPDKQAADIINVYIYIYIHMYMYTCVYIYIIYIYIYIYIYVYTYIVMIIESARDTRSLHRGRRDGA